jgi:hypothetical protein
VVSSMLLFSCVVGVADSVPSQWTECVLFQLRSFESCKNFSSDAQGLPPLFGVVVSTILLEKRVNVFKTLNNNRIRNSNLT